jgi:hypothetical protein
MPHQFHVLVTHMYIQINYIGFIDYLEQKSVQEIWDHCWTINYIGFIDS